MPINTNLLSLSTTNPKFVSSVKQIFSSVKPTPIFSSNPPQRTTSLSLSLARSLAVCCLLCVSLSLPQASTVGAPNKLKLKSSQAKTNDTRDNNTLGWLLLLLLLLLLVSFVLGEKRFCKTTRWNLRDFLALPSSFLFRRAVAVAFAPFFSLAHKIKILTGL